MYLSKLELVGFKSFAQKTDFRFTPGLTVLVGPNGSGKTNIVDALRWVLGEQKTTVLRSGLMENVIFNGTENRKKLGMAEVSLTMQNNRNLLPTEYTEVTVARRLFRSGESHYLLNNTQCRLRDIIDLFMDTGIGADSYSVIELKMVETILSGKPEERRHLIEEAAGVTKYKVRRKEASRKLIHVQQDLLRVLDIVEEVGKQVRSLSRQASKTRRYNAFQQELSELEINMFKHKYFDLSNFLKQENNIISELRVSKYNKEKELSEKNQDLESIEKEIDILNEKYNTARNVENEVNSGLASKSKDLAVVKEKVAGLRDKEKNFQREVEESQDTIEDLKNRIQSFASKLEVLNKEKEEIDSKADVLKSIRDEKQNNVSEIRNQVDEKHTELINVQNKINSLKSEINRYFSRKLNLEKKKNEISQKKEIIQKEILAVENNINRQKDNQDELIIQQENAEKVLTECQQAEEKLRKEIDSLNSKISENRNILSGKKTSLGFLSSLINADESSKYLLRTDDWKPKSEKILFAELIGADEEHRAAVDAALGGYGRLFVVDSQEEALAAFHSLENKAKGKATFLCKDLIEEVKPQQKSIEAPGVIGYLSELVRTDDKLLHAVRAVFKDTLLVDSLEHAIAIVNNKLAWTAVTLKGELVRRGGIIRGGAKLKEEGLSVGKKERIEKLNKEILEFENQLSTYQEELNKTKSELSKINIHFLTKQVRDSERAFNENKSYIEKLLYKKESLENSFTMQNQNTDRFTEELQEILSDNEDVERQKTEFETNLPKIQEEYSKIKSQLEDADNSLSVEEESLHNAEKEKIKAITDIKNIRSQINNLGNQKKNLLPKVENRKLEIEQNKRIIRQLEQNIEEFTKEIEELKIKSAEALNKKDYTNQQLATEKEKYKQQNDDFVQERKLFDKLIQRIYDRELKITEFNAKLKHLLESTIEKYSVNLEETDFEPDENFDMEETTKHVNYLKEKLSSIGNVNFMALEEYETQNARYQFYNEQVQDLTDSEKTLQETIEEINQTAEEKFIKTFEDIDANFKRLFIKLFGEGAEGTLILTEGNPLEADIEIIAKPPGKKPHSIDTISSGEKTLTAIALLFAIYLVKPSPFCILDEVDAPLDDTNIDKFLALIRDFNTNTQFMIVTHNKKTMSAADTLYGITMQETGVSKIVSVRLTNEQK